MDVRSVLTVFGLASATFFLTSCDDYYYGHGGGDDNEVVFGIRQRVDPATGQNEVSASYDFIGLANKGGSYAAVFRDGDGDGVCYFEQYDQRLGALHVDSGVATWTGGKLPSAGLQVLANTAMPAKYTGDGWSAGDTLTFDVSGFAMPRLETVTLEGPGKELDAIAFTPAAADASSPIAIKSTDDVKVTWTPNASITEPAHVIVTLETEENGTATAGVRCFDRPETGTATIPARWVARLFSSVDGSKAIAGHLAVASHRQVTYFARGNWTAYIVATTEHQAQAFTGSR